MPPIPTALLAALRQNTTETYLDLIENEDICFLVDHRAEDESIVESCENILKTGCLSAELVEADNPWGYAVFIVYRNERIEVPLTGSGADRHITLHCLNQLIAPDYEVRWVAASDGADTLAFIPLSNDDWAEAEQLFPVAVRQNFLAIEASPNLFTDTVKQHQQSAKKWWQFWK